MDLLQSSKQPGVNTAWGLMRPLAARLGTAGCTSEGQTYGFRKGFIPSKDIFS